ncbi:MAG TPA: choice-of-anchor tandem repeat GloVer-containing protein [Candidatus Binatia bacterium]|nr:choice-of-anchor tandem repeat GloVer-containing protein [Candidatus Binatia bacterium]
MPVGGIQDCGDQLHRNSCGTVFELTANGQFKILWQFTRVDGAYPEGELLIGPGGILYGSTSSGGASGYGTIFSLAPPTTPQETQWTRTILHSFAGNQDGALPTGPLAMDRAGNLYGSTYAGGSGANWGTVFELSPYNGGWSEAILHRFSYSDGDAPFDGVTLDAAGNLYGTTRGGGPVDSGAVYQLLAGSGWQENTIYGFRLGGWDPQSGVTLDSSGNLYGSTFGGGSNGAGTVFELFHGDWIPQIIYNFYGGNEWGPNASKVIFDVAGNLYGTTCGDGAYGAGSVFKLTLSDGAWTYTSLHDFTGGIDGASPVGTLVLDANGNIYGTTSGGGQNFNGVVFRITP